MQVEPPNPEGVEQVQDVGFHIGHAVLRSTLFAALRMPDDYEAAFSARLKRTITLFRPKKARTGRRTGNRRYGLRDVLEIALSLQLQRAFVSDGSASEFIMRERPTLHAAWARGLAKHDAFVLNLPIDAFAVNDARRPQGTDNPSNPSISIGRGGEVDDGRPILLVDISRLAMDVIEALRAQLGSPSALDAALDDLITHR